MKWINFEKATSEEQQQLNDAKIEHVIFKYDTGEFRFLSDDDLPRSIATHYIILPEIND